MEAAHFAKSIMHINGKKVECDVYEDGTAVVAGGTRIIQLTEKQMEAVRERVYAEQTKNIQKYEKERSKEKSRNTPAKEKKERPPLTQLKAVVITLLYAAAIVGSAIGSGYLMDNYERQVQIAAIASPIAKDAELTAAHLTPLSMSASNYDRLRAATDGELILWRNAESIVGSRMRFDTIKGQYITTGILSNQPVITNPWETSAGMESKLYTMPFDATSVHSVLPGNHLKMYVITTKVDKDGTVHLTEYGGTNSGMVQTIAPGSTTPVEQPLPVADVDVDVNEDELDGDDADNEILDENTEAATEILSKVSSLFDDITVVDLKNGEGQSIYGQYLSLARMDSASREALLRERAESPNAQQYLNKFFATSIVFALDDEQASELNKIDKLPNASVNYAVLPSANVSATDEQRSLYLTFVEVQNQISNIFGDLVNEKRR